MNSNLEIARFSALKAARRFWLDPETREDAISEAIVAVLEHEPQLPQQAASVAYYAALAWILHWLFCAPLKRHDMYENVVGGFSDVHERTQSPIVFDDEETDAGFNLPARETAIKAILKSARKNRAQRGRDAVEREYQILALIIEGHTNQQIADHMNMNLGAVKTSRLRMRQVLEKIKVNR